MGKPGDVVIVTPTLPSASFIYQPPAALTPTDDQHNLTPDGFYSYQSVADPNTAYPGSACPATPWPSLPAPARSGIPCGSQAVPCWKW